MFKNRCWRVFLKVPTRATDEKMPGGGPSRGSPSEKRKTAFPPKEIDTWELAADFFRFSTVAKESSRTIQKKDAAKEAVHEGTSLEGRKIELPQRLDRFACCDARDFLVFPPTVHQARCVLQGLVFPTHPGFPFHVLLLHVEVPQKENK